MTSKSNKLTKYYPKLTSRIQEAHELRKKKKTNEELKLTILTYRDNSMGSIKVN